MKNLRARSIGLFLLGASPLVPACGELPSTDVDETQAELVGGTNSNARKEIGLIDTWDLQGKAAQCTATLVDPLYLITSSTCAGRFSGQVDHSSVPQYFRMRRTDGTNYPPIQMSRVYSITNQTGSKDVGFVRLSTPVAAATAKPATLANVPVGAGQQSTVYGHGCKGASQPKNYVTFNYGDTAKKALICSTDSYDQGGPRFFGSSTGTTIWGINSKAAPTGGSDTVASIFTSNAGLVLAGLKLLGGTTLGASNFIFPASYQSQPDVQTLTGDFDGDGHSDLALATGMSFMMAFGDGIGHFSVMEEWILPSSARGSKRRIAGDFDGNGTTDLAFVGKDGWGTIPMLLSQRGSRGGFDYVNLAAPEFTALANATGAYAVAGDWDRDGTSDIALLGGAGWTTVPTAFSNRDGTFNFANRTVASFPADSRKTNAKALVGDFDNDGGSDIALVGQGGGKIPVIFSRGGGDFDYSNQTVAQFPAWATQSGAKLLAGDFDGDGYSDLAMLAGTDPMTAKIALSTGAQSLATGAPYGGFSPVILPLEADHFIPTAKYVAPVFENGRDNLAWIEPTQGQVFTYFGKP
jgi:hypothetical protein